MKKNLLILIIFIVIVIIILSIYMFNYAKEKERYNEIEEAFEEAIIWNLDATGNSKKHCEENITKEMTITADHLISNGYLKKEDMLDTSGKSYCDGYAKTFVAEDCDIDYKIYIKCNDYKTKGYKDYKWNDVSYEKLTETIMKINVKRLI